MGGLRLAPRLKSQVGLLPATFAIQAVSAFGVLTTDPAAVPAGSAGSLEEAGGGMWHCKT